MKKNRVPLIVFVVGLLLVAVVAVANHGGSAGRYVPYQGHLESNGTPVTTIPGAGRNITFTFYDAESGGNLLDTSTHIVDVSAGKFAVNIGPIPDAVFASADLFVAVSVEGSLLAGRQKVHGSTYAVRGEVGKPFAVDELNADFDVSAGRDVIAAEDLIGSRVVVEEAQFSSSLGKKINLWNSSYGFGISDSTLQVYTPNVAAVKFGAMDGEVFTEGTSFYPDGRILSPRFKVSNFFEVYSFGPSQSAGTTVTSNGGRLLIQFTVNGYRDTVGNILFQLVVDNVVRATYTRWANEVSSHKSISGNFAIALPAGSHTIEFRADSNTITDSNDMARGTVMELPF